jgi:hypothetical protein
MYVCIKKLKKFGLAIATLGLKVDPSLFGSGYGAHTTQHHTTLKTLSKFNSFLSRN